MLTWYPTWTPKSNFTGVINLICTMCSQVYTFEITTTSPKGWYVDGTYFYHYTVFARTMFQWTKVGKSWTCWFLCECLWGSLHHHIKMQSICIVAFNYHCLGPYKFSLQASVDHHGYSMNSGHYTASINCCGKTFHCNNNKITECNITDPYNSSTAYIL